ncbi:MAG: prolyl oligopeptidase family serine peptidase, partial [Cyclobacteriaceae bacterium]
MEKKLTGFLFVYFALNLVCFSQVDTTFIYSTGTPFGALDIRIAKSATNYYYLQENRTFNFRESAPGVKTNTYRDMTSWDSSPYKEGHLKEKTETEDNFVMNYRLKMPEGYNPAYTDGYPIIFMLHGYGERGNCAADICYHADRDYLPKTNNPAAPTNIDHELLNNDHNLLHGGRTHLSAVTKAGGKLPDDATLDPKAFPGFVLFPQNFNGWDHFAVQDAIRILRLIMKKYKINPDRVYIEGLSNGGHGLYEAIKRAPWLFSAAIAMSAIDDGFVNVQGMAPKIAHIPLWIFQG